MSSQSQKKRLCQGWLLPSPPPSPLPPPSKDKEKEKEKDKEKDKEKRKKKEKKNKKKKKRRKKGKNWCHQVDFFSPQSPTGTHVPPLNDASKFMLRTQLESDEEKEK